MEALHAISLVSHFMQNYYGNSLFGKLNIHVSEVWLRKVIAYAQFFA